MHARVLVVALLLAAAPAGAQTRMVPQFGHTDLVVRIATSKDGKLFVTGGRDGEVKLWDLASGALLWSGAHARREIVGVAFLPDGKRLVSAGADLTVRTWDLATGAQLRRFEAPHRGANHDAALLPDGKRIVLAGGDRVQLWNIETAKLERELLLKLKWEKSSVVRVTPDGVRALAWTNADGADMLRVWNLATGVEEAAVKTGNGERLLAIAPDGKRVLSGGLDKATLRDVATLAVTTTYAIPRPQAAAFTADGASILAAGDKGLAVIPVGASAPARTITAQVHSFALTPDGKRLIAGDSLIEVLDLATGKSERRLAPETRLPICSAWSPDGKHLLVGYNDGLIIQLDAANAGVDKVITKIDATVRMITFSPDGALVAWGDGVGDIVVWTRATDKRRNLTVKGTVTSLAFSPDGGRLFAKGKSSFGATMFDLGTGAQVEYDGLETRGVIGVSPDGSRVAGYGGITLRIFDATTGRQLEEVRDKGPAAALDAAAIDWSADGTTVRIVVGTDRMFLTYRLGSNRLERFAGTHSDLPVAAFTRDHKLAATGGVGMNGDLNAAPAIVLWDLDARKPLRTLAGGHVKSVIGLSFSPDGKHLASTSPDRTVRIWNVATGSSIALLTDRDEWIAYTDAGYFDASRRGGTMLAAVDGLVAHSVEQLAVRTNRPDLVLGHVGLGTPDLIAHYEARHKRRLEKLKLTDGRAARFDRAPRVAITGANQTGTSIALELDLAATGADLTALQIAVNQVPLFAGAGKPISGRGAKLVETVALLPGTNRVEVSAVDADGLESLRAYRDVALSGDDKGALHYIGFGVSKYRDRDLDLAFAHRDALDLARVFEQTGKAFTAVHVHTFVDDKATRANLIAAKRLLAGAKTEDTVVVFIAGHGTHTDDAAADYYFATHETEVARLRETAAPFELVEDLLAGIAPRKKLLLLDTCESGERTEAELASGDAPGARKLRPRSTRKLVRVASASPAAKPRPYLFDRERFIYNDLSRRTGAVVFSSSQGAELSYETAELGHGVFTHAVIQTLVDASRDDAMIDIDALRTSVAPLVAQLTDGRQHPTIDRDNPAIALRVPRAPGAKLEAPAVATPPPAVTPAPAPTTPIAPPTVRTARGCCSGAPDGSLALALLVLLAGRRRR